MTGRRQARRTALFLLYQWDLTGQPLTALYEGSPTRSRSIWPRPSRARAEELDRRITACCRGLDRRSAGYARAEHPEDRDPRAGGGERAAGGGDERGCRAGEAVRVRGRGAARERDSRPRGQGGGRMKEAGSADEALGRAEELLERLKATRDELERLAAQEDAESAVEVLTELADLAKEVEAELAKARARADAPHPDELRALVEGYLGELAFTPELGRLEEALRYPLESGGKRVRPGDRAGGRRGGRRRRRARACPRPPQSSSCTRSRSSTTTCRRWTTTTSAAAGRPHTSRSARRQRSLPATRCSPRRSGSRSRIRRRWSAASSRRRRWR